MISLVFYRILLTHSRLSMVFLMVATFLRQGSHRTLSVQTTHTNQLHPYPHDRLLTYAEISFRGELREHHFIIVLAGSLPTASSFTKWLWGTTGRESSQPRFMEGEKVDSRLVPCATHSRPPPSTAPHHRNLRHCVFCLITAVSVLFR